MKAWPKKKEISEVKMKQSKDKLMLWNRIVLGILSMGGYLWIALLEIHLHDTFTLAQTWPLLAYAVIRAVFTADKVDSQNGNSPPPAP